MARFRDTFFVPSSSSGFSLVELLLVLGVIAICLTLAGVALGNTVALHAARGAAQCWQAAAAWAELGVMWQGGSSEVFYDAETLAVSHVLGVCGGDLGSSAPKTVVATNVAAWRKEEAVMVRFTGTQASPNGGGSLYFYGLHGAYRVAVRPESGLTVRSLTGELP